MAAENVTALPSGDFTLEVVRLSSETCDDPGPSRFEQLAKTYALNASIGINAFLQRRALPNRRTPANAKALLARTPAHSPRSGLALARITEGAWEVSVSVAVTGLPSLEGWTEGGVIAHVIPRGRVEAGGHARATAPVKPRLGVTVMVAVPFCPAVNARTDGESLRAKSGFPILMVTVPEDTLA